MGSRQETVENIKLKLSEWNAKLHELEVQTKLAESFTQLRIQYCRQELSNSGTLGSRQFQSWSG